MQDYRARSPSSSPSLAPVDSSPQSSPNLTAIFTPPPSPGPKDPFAGSNKSDRRPRIYERNASHKSSRSIDACNADDDAVRVLTRLGRSDMTDSTPTRLARVVDPFSGSAKQEWRPPTYEKKNKRVNLDGSGRSASPSSEHGNRSAIKFVSHSPVYRASVTRGDDTDDFELTDDDFDIRESRAPLKTRAEMEHEKWDGAITDAIERLSGVIDLRGNNLGGPFITHIPPDQIADLERRVVLPSGLAPSTAPPSPTLPVLAPTSSSSRPLTRATTMPASAFHHNFFTSKDGEVLRGTPAARAASLQAGAQQPTTQFLHEIHLYLGNNSIARLPPELFRLSALAVLSLWSNGLTFVPPQIVQLTALKELNLAQNKLRWLPAEMLQMRLTKLMVSGNPWIAPSGSGTSSSVDSTPHPVSETTVHFSIPPLTEFCLRALVTPSSPTPAVQPRRPTPHTQASDPAEPSPQPPPQIRSLTILEASYDLPLTEDLDISPNIFAILRACVPAAVARPAEPLVPTKVRRDDARLDVHSHRSTHTTSHPNTDNGDNDDDVFAPPTVPQDRARCEKEDEITGVSVCPSPRHRAEDGSWRDGRVPVFVRHAEERWTWEAEVAGVRVGAEGVGGVGVPVKWRGCSRGCLAFLDSPIPPSQPPPACEARPVGEGAVREEEDAVAEGGELDLDLGLDGDVEMGDLRLDGGLADPEDFEEAF